jgi:hypothetical protein
MPAFLIRQPFRLKIGMLFQAVVNSGVAIEVENLQQLKRG